MVITAQLVPSTFHLEHQDTEAKGEASMSLDLKFRWQSSYSNPPPTSGIVPDVTVMRDPIVEPPHGPA